MIVMLTALGLAWPHPLAIVAVAAIDCVALVLAAFRWRLPVLHAGAIACATLAYLTGFHVIYSDLPLFDLPMPRRCSRRSSAARAARHWSAYSCCSPSPRKLIARRGRRRHALIYAGGAGVMALLGLTLTTVHGLHGGGDAIRAADSLRDLRRRRPGSCRTLAQDRVELPRAGLLTAAPLWALWENPQMHANPAAVGRRAGRPRR